MYHDEISFCKVTQTRIALSVDTEPAEVTIAVCITVLTAVSRGKGSFYMHTLGCAKAFLETHKRDLVAGVIAGW